MSGATATQKAAATKLLEDNPQILRHVEAALNTAVAAVLKTSKTADDGAGTSEDVVGIAAEQLMARAAFPTVDKIEVRTMYCPAASSANGCLQACLVVKYCGTLRRFFGQAVPLSVPCDDALFEPLLLQLNQAMSGVTLSSLSAFDSALEAGLEAVSSEKAETAAEHTDEQQESVDVEENPSAAQVQGLLTAASLAALSCLEQTTVHFSHDHSNKERPEAWTANMALSYGHGRSRALLAQTLSHQPDQQFKPLPPIPLVHVMSFTGGKLKLAGAYAFSPKLDSSAPKAMASFVASLSQHVAKKSAQGTAPMSTSGAFLVGLDKLDQALDLLTDAASSAGLQPGSDICFALDVHGSGIHDSNKGRYEIAAGVAKSAADWCGELLQLCKTKPGLKLILDPFADEDKEHWHRLAEESPQDVTVFVVRASHSRQPQANADYSPIESLPLQPPLPAIREVDADSSTHDAASSAVVSGTTTSDSPNSEPSSRPAGISCSLQGNTVTACISAARSARTAGFSTLFTVTPDCHATTEKDLALAWAANADYVATPLPMIAAELFSEWEQSLLFTENKLQDTADGQDISS